MRQPVQSVEHSRCPDVPALGDEAVEHRESQWADEVRLERALDRGVSGGDRSRRGGAGLLQVGLFGLLLATPEQGSAEEDDHGDDRRDGAGLAVLADWTAP
ncbi:MAG: hypothetical protein U1E45_00420 [Geminicoccaceae bacterium]